MLIPMDLPKAEALGRARDLGISGAYLAEDTASREALLLSLIFERWPDLIPVTPPLSAVQRFYSEDFWFRRFVYLWQQAEEADIGLEQQAFRKLAETSADIDWMVIEELDLLASAKD
jgi:hypothetical protein